MNIETIDKPAISTDLPEWFVQDKNNYVEDDVIQDKLKIEIHNEVLNRGYDMTLWTDSFVERIAHTYFKFFNQLYYQQ